MEIFQTIAYSLLPYHKSISLLAGIIGEDFLMLLAIFSGSDIISFWIVLSFGFIGVMIHDSIIYLMARSKFAYRLKEKWNLSERNKGLVSFIEKIGGKTYFLPLMISKFVYGTRLALIVFISHRELNFFKYTVKNALAVAIWSAIMLPIAWLAGRGFARLLHLVKGVEKLLGFIVLTALVIYFVRKLFTLEIFQSKKFTSPSQPWKGVSQIL